jgi:hypothetical protein
VIADDGSFYSEDRVRLAIERINVMVKWIESLPAETQDILKWEGELRQ